MAGCQSEASMQSRAIHGLLAAGCLLLCPCAAVSAPGLETSANPGYVAAVEVTPRGPDISATFVETLKQALLAEAAEYGASGRPLTVRVDLEKLHFKNAAKALLIGDDNMAKGRVEVVDPATGQAEGTFQVRVNADRGGAGVGLLTVLDPTGVSEVAVAAAGSGGGSRVEAGLSSNFAMETMRRVYGDARARQVHRARKRAAKSRH
jgi:hypothetical protein